MTNEGVTARTFARKHHQEAIGMLRELASIGAPTRHEQARAEWVRNWIAAQTNGQADVRIDSATNVIWHIPAGRKQDDDGALAISAHTDVVFDDEKHDVREEDGRMHAPGVGDDTANLVVMLLCARDLWQQRSLLIRDVFAVANSCEEGLGNLDGSKAFYAQEGSRVDEHVAFDCYLGEAVNGAVGSHRWRMSVQCAGGHSYFDFGAPNAIKEISTLISDFYALDRPEDTTVNVGCVEGGTTVNAIAAYASALLEYRSPNENDLAIMRKRLESLVARHEREGVTVELEVLGIRPGAGKVDAIRQQALLARALGAMRLTCGMDAKPESASTDANIPLSLGIPAICVGAVSGAGMHTRGEWIDIASLEDGLAFAHQLVWGEALLTH